MGRKKGGPYQRVQRKYYHPRQKEIKKILLEETEKVTVTASQIGEIIAAVLVIEVIDERGVMIKGRRDSVINQVRNHRQRSNRQNRALMKKQDQKLLCYIVRQNNYMKCPIRLKS